MRLNKINAHSAGLSILTCATLHCSRSLAECKFGSLPAEEN